MAKVIGIDLGTTNSVVAVMEGGEPVVIANAEGSRTTPSVVGLNKAGERLVGQVAKRQSVVNPEQTIFSVKRFMGRKLSDPSVARDLKLVPYRMTSAASNGDVRVLFDGREYAPQEIAAMVLQKLKADAEAYLGEPVLQAVITVPAYFNDIQRQATKDAGKIAGLEVLRIINEPTASALAYGLERQSSQTIAVYDLGGGTFDISVLELGDGVFEVKATNGDTHLGGDDFDQRVIDWMADEFLREERIDLRNDRTALQRLKEAAEKAKMELSTVLQTEISLPFISADASGPRHLNVLLSRAKLEQLTGDLVEATIKPIRDALADAGLRPNDIDEVVLVGGQTRMPSVQEAVRKFFGREPHRGVNPDEVVAIGAAVQAGVLSGEVKDVLLLDVTPLTLGIETMGGVMAALIERNTTIPTRRSQVFSTASDNQQSVEVHVVQGERAEARFNKSLGRFELSGIPAAPRGVPQIEVTFDIDANGILNVSAIERGTGIVQRISVTASSGLSPEEVDRMVHDAEQFAAEDQVRREIILARNSADGLIYSAERVLREVVGGVSDELRARVGAAMVALREVREGDDVVAMRDQAAALTELLREMSASDMGNGEVIDAASV